MRILLLILFILVLGCNTNSDNGMIAGPDPNDNGNGEGAPVSFATDVLPIFVASCSGSGCHHPGAQSGVRLGSWALATGSVGIQYGGPVILPGNAAQSPLVEKLGSAPRFGLRMPDGRPALPATQIQTIVTWINEGAANN